MIVSGLGDIGINYVAYVLFIFDHIVVSSINTGNKPGDNIIRDDKYIEVSPPQTNIFIGRYIL